MNRRLSGTVKQDQHLHGEKPWQPPGKLCSFQGAWQTSTSLGDRMRIAQRLYLYHTHWLHVGTKSSGWQQKRSWSTWWSRTCSERLFEELGTLAVRSVDRCHLRLLWPLCKVPFYSNGGVENECISNLKSLCLTSNHCCTNFSRSIKKIRSLLLSLERNCSFGMVAVIVSVNTP